MIGDDGIEKWLFEGQPVGSMGLNAVVSWPKEEWGFDPIGFAEMRPGAYDVHERVRDMNRNGILASMCFPTFAGFAGGMFQEAADKDLALAMVQAYNDWHIDEWCAALPRAGSSPSPSRRSGTPQLVADEVRRVAAKGCRAITMPELPHIEGLPSYIDLDYWAPFFEAVSEEQVVMCLHIGQGFNAITSAPDAPIDNLIILATQVSALAAQDLLWGGGDAQLPRPQGRVVGGRHRLDPLLPRPLRPSLRQPAVAAVTTSATSCRATSSASTRSRVT